MHIPRGSLDAYDGLVFDCDGTLVDTMPAHYVAWRTTMERHGIVFEEELFYSLGGVPSPKIVELLAARAGVTLDAIAVSDEKERVYAEAMTAVQPVHAVLAIAERYRGRKPMAVATGAHRWVAHHSLDLIGVREWFDAIVTFEDVTHAKPAPDTYALAAEKLGVAARDCLAFEDAEPGLESARAAGMDVIDVRPMHRADHAGGR